ncbi:hypothetical protein THF1C08_150016 [Vibrio jasicida]|uniref:Uncharacterized protein n=1 Tax=Vibrio jasicida TaxID=766224 RepID=A0AAU9QJ32_9VIBR|nr:hypothetical protein THF1C08_150016 [Vibrio jasicida]CAH1577782.1 hypothetical protein THF1A12_150017 [Vibrio jasicida]
MMIVFYVAQKQRRPDLGTPSARLYFYGSFIGDAVFCGNWYYVEPTRIV